MSNEGNQNPGQDPNVLNQAGATGTGTGEPGAGQDPNAGIKDLESAKAALADVRKEAASYRTEKAKLAKELEEARAQLKKIEDAQLSETDRLKKELEEAKAQAEAGRKAMQDSRIVVAAAKLGFADPNDALAFIDRSGIGDDGAGIDDALKAVLKSKPYLKAGAQGQQGGQGAGNPQGGADAANQANKVERAKSNFPFLQTRR